MTDETTLPEAEGLPDAGAGDQQTDAAPADENQEGQQTEKPKEEKPEAIKALERELAKERRRNQALSRRTHAAEAEAQQLRVRPNLQNEPTGDKTSGDEDPDIVRIPRAELPKLAERLKSEAVQRDELQKAVSTMRKGLGDDFQDVTDTLANDIGFSADLQFAVAASEAPAELARYLIDPDNADEAERIARMSPYQAGRALAKIEAKLAEPEKEKPQPSKAASPLQPVRGSGGNTVDRPPSDTRAYMQWANKKYGRY